MQIIHRLIYESDIWVLFVIIGLFSFINKKIDKNTLIKLKLKNMYINFIYSYKNCFIHTK